MNLHRRRLIAAALAFALPNDALADDAVTVFAAISLQDALSDIAAAYRRRAGVRVRFSFAASSTLARQIEQGAPADVFVSADEAWMEYLSARRLIVEASRMNLCSNRIALIAPARSRAQLRIARDFPLARALGGGRLAVADPASVPAGRYAEAALRGLGVWADVENRLARAENVRAALAFVARGEAPFGVVYRTDARIEPRVRIIGLFPENTHPRILYPAARVAASTHPGAQRLLDFLVSPAAQAIFTHYGFTP